jgi:hypothetical protein
MNTYMRVEVMFHELTLALHADEWPPSLPTALPLVKSLRQPLNRMLDGCQNWSIHEYVLVIKFLLKF